MLDKPAGWTSHQVVGRVRRILGTRKVGHAGTLDPMATGVLVVGVGQATRLLGHLAKGSKAYAATIRLGQETLTDDAEGELTRARGAAGIDAATVAAALPAFTGTIAQRPSAVSAIKVGGVRSYARVRSGQQVDLAERPVKVTSFVLRSATARPADGVLVLDCEVTVDCSSGTYVRALARDLGALLGTGGHLTALRRTAVVPFTLADAVTLDALAAAPALVDLTAVARRCFATCVLDDRCAAEVTFGRSLPNVSLPATPTALLGPSGEFLALYRPEGDSARPVAVFVRRDRDTASSVVD